MIISNSGNFLKIYSFSHEVFEASKEARYYEGLWELASVDESIITHNHLYSILETLREELEEIYSQASNVEVARLQSETGAANQDIITLQKRKEFLVS